MPQKTLEDLQNEIKFSTLDELNYLRVRFCMPNSVIIRNKMYDYEASRAMVRLVNDAIEIQAFEEICLSDE